MGDKTGLERRIRKNRRSKLDEYIACRVELRNGFHDRRTDQRRNEDNTFVANWLEKFHAQSSPYR
jgi:hypothetical protein